MKSVLSSEHDRKLQTGHLWISSHTHPQSAIILALQTVFSVCRPSGPWDRSGVEQTGQQHSGQGADEHFKLSISRQDQP